MFQTLADGYWRSTDLIDWNHKKPSAAVDSIIAPAAWSDGEKIISASMMEAEAIFHDRSGNWPTRILVRRMPPLTGSVDKGPEEMKPGEVPTGRGSGLFKDDDGRWYMYWGRRTSPDVRDRDRVPDAVDYKASHSRAHLIRARRWESSPGSSLAGRGRPSPSIWRARG